MTAQLAQLDAPQLLGRLIFVGGPWPIFWGVVAAFGLVSVLWLVIVDGILRRGFGMTLFLKAIACLWVGIIATAMATSATDGGTAGIFLMGAACVGMIVYLYTVERRFVSTSTGVALTVLRLLLVCVLFAMMAEPIVAMNRTETMKRCLAVLADESISMDVVDDHTTPGERLRLADALGKLTELARPIRLEGEAAALQSIGHRLEPHGKWLSEILRGRSQHTEVTATAEKRRRLLHESLEGLTSRASGVVEVLTTMLEDRQSIPRESLGDLIDLRSRLGSQVVDPLETLAEQIGDKDRFEALSPDEIRRLTQLHADSVRGLAAIVESMSQAGRRIDDAFARRADSETRQAMDDVAAMSRRQIIAGLLSGEGEGLLGRLVEDVDVRYYTFARSARASALGQALAALNDTHKSPPTVAVATTPSMLLTTLPTTTSATTSAWATTVATTRPSGDQPDPPGNARSRTDLASALGQVTTDLPLERLTGIVVLSDGRHNADGDPVKAAKALGAQGVGVYPIIIGARQAPVDAAIVKLDVPDTVHVEDTMDVTVSIRADGLKGKMLQVRLLDDSGRSLELRDEDQQGRLIRSDKPLRAKTVSIATNHERHDVRLSHKPTGKGRHVYRVVMDTLSEEVFPENNRQVFAVDVTDETTKVLIVDGMPRWEFRYLRNLLARDESVRLQHVLFDPALIARQPEFKQVPARVTNERSEADRLPDSAEDLNAFDVIVLGDIDCDDLPRDQQLMIDRFVADRGGTLVVVAGKRHMPARYEGRPLATLLPVTLDASRRPTATAPSRAAGFLLTLTGEGANHIVSELAVDPEANKQLWEALPEMYWRSMACVAKGGASVLAWAKPAMPTVRTPTTRGSTDSPQAQPTRQRAMLVAQNYGLGKVLFLAWDATWRFRYKHGDKYHHKFWGQVLRWATTGKLPTGLKLVKIGTDKARYAEGDPVLLRAKFTRLDFTPMADAEVRGEIREGQRSVASVRMTYVPGSPGIYEGTVPGLRRGRFSVALDSPQIETLRRRDDPTGEVTTTIVVDAEQSAERLELAANAALMTQLADAGGGAIVEPTAGDRLAEYVRTDPIVKHINQQVTVWDKWWLLALFGGIIGAEWILRKRAGLM